MALTCKISFGPGRFWRRPAPGSWSTTPRPSARAVRGLLDQPGKREEMGRRAQAALIPHQGAARRQAELIAALAQKVPAEG